MFRHVLKRAVLNRLLNIGFVPSNLPLCPAWPGGTRYHEMHRSFSASSIISNSRAASQARGVGLPTGDDTIYALSSAPGKGGIAVIRISGPKCLDVRFLVSMALF